MARTGSILAADFGNVTTRVVLFDMVDGEYRLVARGETLNTLGAPHDDISIGLRRIVRDMGGSMSRTFMDKSGRIIVPETADRSGVDYFVTTASAGRPLRAVMIGLLEEVSLRSALRAIGGAYVEVVGTINLYSAPTEELQLNAVLLNRPDLIFIVGGTDGGAKTALLNLLQGVKLALQVTDAGSRPLVLYAGNNQLVPQIQRLFGDLTQVFIAGNVRPTLDSEQIESAQLALGKAYDAYKERYSEGFEVIGAMSETGVLPTAQSYTLIASYLAQMNTGNVIAVDMGSASTVLVGVFNNQTTTRISPQRGLGHSANVMLDEIGRDGLRQWLPMYITDTDIQNYTLNKSLRPSSVPATQRELYLEHALLRAGIRDLVTTARPTWLDDEEADADLPPIRTVLAGGAALTRTGSPALDMLLITDSLQPTGVTEILADPYGVVPALGGLARVNPQATVQLLDANNLEQLGTLVSISGTPKKDKVAAKLRITTEGEKVDYQLMGGHVLMLPLPAGYTLDIDIRLQGNLTVGGKSRLKLKLMGGSAGILLDARGRTFSAGATVEERAINLPMWTHEVTEEPLQVIPAEWLVPLLDEQPTLEAITGTATPAKATTARRGWFGRGKPKVGEPMPTIDDINLDDDDEFMRLMNEDPSPKAGQTGRLRDPNAKKQTGPLPDDMDDLRGLL